MISELKVCTKMPNAKNMVVNIRNCYIDMCPEYAKLMIVTVWKSKSL